MDALVTAYLLYLVTAIALTGVVGHTLSRHGKVYLADVFGHDPRLARSVNQLLVLGFYLISFGFIALSLSTDGHVTGIAEVIEVLSVKLGVVALGLGVLHLVNIMVFNGIRRRHREEVRRGDTRTSQASYPGTAASFGASPR